MVMRETWRKTIRDSLYICGSIGVLRVRSESVPRAAAGLRFIRKPRLRPFDERRLEWRARLHYPIMIFACKLPVLESLTGRAALVDVPVGRCRQDDIVGEALSDHQR